MSYTDWIGKSTFLLAIGGTGVFIAAVIVGFLPKTGPLMAALTPRSLSLSTVRTNVRTIQLNLQCNRLNQSHL